MEEGGKRGVVTNGTRRDVTLELVEERKMTDTEVEVVASLLFSWWKREFEQQLQERLESNMREQ